MSAPTLRDLIPARINDGSGLSYGYNVALDSVTALVTSVEAAGYVLMHRDALPAAAPELLAFAHRVARDRFIGKSSLGDAARDAIAKATQA